MSEKYKQTVIKDEIMSRKATVVMSLESWLRIVCEVIVEKVYLDTNITQQDILWYKKQKKEIWILNIIFEHNPNHNPKK